MLGAARVVTCSDRASSGEYEDRSGPVLVEALQSWGFDTPDAWVVADGDVDQALATVLAEAPAVVLTTGGTGVGPRDCTPEATRDVLDQEVPGIAEALRQDGLSRGIHCAMVSRGVAGFAGDTLIINVAGSPGAAKDAAALLEKVVPHAVHQRRGGDHS